MGSVVYPYLVLSELEFIDYELVAVHYYVLVIMNALNRPTLLIWVQTFALFQTEQ
jgi:hypothetical protein